MSIWGTVSGIGSSIGSGLSTGYDYATDTVSTGFDYAGSAVNETGDYLTNTFDAQYTTDKKGKEGLNEVGFESVDQTRDTSEDDLITPELAVDDENKGTVANDPVAREEEFDFELARDKTWAERNLVEPVNRFRNQIGAPVETAFDTAWELGTGVIENISLGGGGGSKKKKRQGGGQIPVGPITRGQRKQREHRQRAPGFQPGRRVTTRSGRAGDPTGGDPTAGGTTPKTTRASAGGGLSFVTISLIGAAGYLFYTEFIQ